MNRLEFPQHWKVLSLEEGVCIFDKNRVPLNESQRQQMQGEYPYCGANGALDYIDDYIFDGEYVLLAEDGGHWGSFENSAYLMKGKFWVNNHAHILQAKRGLLENFFLMCFLNYLDIGPLISGSTRGKLNQGTMKGIPLFVPPLPEQRAIASVLGAIQEAKFSRQKEIALERERKAALMDYLFSHGTKDEPRKQTEIGEIPESWEVVRLAELCTKITDGTHRTPTYVKKGVPFLRVVDIQSTKIDWRQVKWIPRNEHEELIKRCKPEKGDVLLSKNGTIGKTKVVDWDQEFSIFVSLCLLKVKRKSLNNVYLAEFLSSKGLPQIQKRGKRMTVTNLHLVEIRELLIPVPSLSDQQEIAEILQACDDKIVALEQETARLDELFSAMLEELMTGKRSAIPLIDAEFPN